MDVTSDHTSSAGRECSVCFNETATDTVVKIESGAACYECVRQLFTYAVESEANFPPVWAGQPLHLPDYHHILDSALAVEFQRKAEQYAVPWNERVLCKNSTGHVHSGDIFVGKIQTTGTNPRDTKSCDECGFIYCLFCSEQIAANSDEPHSCKQIEADIGLQGLDRGKDYQICPSCKVTVQLRDGCNHISCICATQFCFICGQPAEGNSNHWVRGGCPRYNHVDSGNPMWQGDILTAPRLEQVQLMIHPGRPRARALEISSERAGLGDEARRQVRAAVVARASNRIAHDSAEYAGQTPRRRATSPRPQSFWRMQERRRTEEALVAFAASQAAPPLQRTSNIGHLLAPVDPAAPQQRLQTVSNLQSARPATGDQPRRSRPTSGSISRTLESRIERATSHHSSRHRHRPSHDHNRLVAAAMEAEFGLHSQLTETSRANVALVDEERSQFQPHTQSGVNHHRNLRVDTDSTVVRVQDRTLRVRYNTVEMLLPPRRHIQHSRNLAIDLSSDFQQSRPHFHAHHSRHHAVDLRIPSQRPRLHSHAHHSRHDAVDLTGGTAQEAIELTLSDGANHLAARPRLSRIPEV